MIGSTPADGATVDSGPGQIELKFDEPVQWTPSIVHQPPTATSSGYTAYAIDNNLTGTTLVNLLLGIKFRVTDAMVIFERIEGVLLDQG